MAELDYDHFDTGYAPVGPRFGRFSQMGGAVLSVALLLGGVVWAYQLAMRDVTGIPVIRAVAGPMRQAPAVPGGSETSHQGLSVNAVAAAGTALPLPETLRLAPKPMDVTDEDIAGMEPLEPQGEATMAAAAPAPAPTSAAVAEVSPVTAVAPAALPQPVPEALPATQEDAVAAALAEALGLEQPAAAPAAEEMASLDATAVEPVVAAAPAAEIAYETIAPGTLLVQLGAFDDQDKARAEWARLTSTFVELMGDKSLVIQPAQSGGKTFYRLRAHGFASDDDTRRFCTAMLAENATCIPVAQR